MRAAGQWNTAWDPFLELDPEWTEQFIATGASIYASNALSTKEIELLSIALDATYTHMYAPGTRRHVNGALHAGASVEEIMAILKLCVAHGLQACNLGVSILADELANAPAAQGRQRNQPLDTGLESDVIRESQNSVSEPP